MLCLLVTVIVLSCSQNDAEVRMNNSISELDLSRFSAEKPDRPLNLLFIHHSCGGQLLADPGNESGKFCIYKSHPNGGALRKLLEENNYVVHEASYGSLIGEHTDICNWNAKFRDNMDKILKCRQQDDFFSDETMNSIIVFKSCYPNSWIESDGNNPGDPDSCEKSLANAKAAYMSLMYLFKAHPGTLFVVMTAPPMAKPRLNKKERIIQFLKMISGRPDTIKKIGLRARIFNNWLKDRENGWLEGYDLNNIAVFDYYDILTGHGKSNWSMYATKGGIDSHPSSDGHAVVSSEFIPFLNRAIRWSGRI